MKKVYWIGGIVIVLVLIGLFGFSKPDSHTTRATINGNAIAVDSLSSRSGDLVPIDLAQSSFGFEGFGPGKSHIGTFDEIEGNILVEGGEIVGVEGKIQAGSVNTGIGGLDEHLKTDDFFDIALFPEITFVSESLVDGMMIGTLTFRGISNKISFPVELTEDSVSADFILDTTPFEMKFLGVDKEVRIFFEFFR